MFPPVSAGIHKGVIQTMETTIMEFTTLKFGKHEGKTIPEVLFSDPSWFFWAFDNGIFQQHGRPQKEAAELAYRARHIKIPRDRPEEWQVNFYANRRGQFMGFLVERKDDLSKTGTGFAFAMAGFSLRHVCQMNKTDAVWFLREIKSYLFGERVRVTKKRAQDFFADKRNFNFCERHQVAAE